VSDGYHFYHLRSVVHNVKDAIVSHPQTVFFCSASELSHSSRPGVLFEGEETFHDSIVDMIGKVFEFFLRRLFQVNRIIHARPLCWRSARYSRKGREGSERRSSIRAMSMRSSLKSLSWSKRSTTALRSGVESA